MRQRSNLIILFGIAFFLVGGAIVFLVLNDEDDDGGSATGGTGVAAEVSVLVAAADIPANTLATEAIADGLLATEQVATGAQPVGAITTADALENRIFAVAVEEGTAITTTQLATRSLSNVQIPEGFDGVAVTVAYTNGGAGYVAPGDTINVYGVFGAGGDAGDAGLSSAGDQPVPRTELVLTNVRVLDVSAQQGTSVQQPAADPATGGQQTLGRQQLDTPLTYLLALRPTDAERLVQVTSFADLYLSLTADNAPNVGDTPGVGGDSVIAPVSADSAAPRS